jgi:hypothetical protein
MTKLIGAFCMCGNTPHKKTYLPYISVHGYAIFRHTATLNVMYWQLPRDQQESQVDCGYAERM